MSDEVKTEGEKKKEDWMNSKWRPMMGWMYMVVCTMDMVVFPILWSLLQTLNHAPITQWNPLTLQGAGLFHIAMGAVLGLAAWGRTQEKLGGANNGGLQVSSLPTGGNTTSSIPPTGASSFGAPAAQNSFGPSGTTGGFGTGSFGSSPNNTATRVEPTFTGSTTPAPVTTGIGGKKVVPDEPQPLL